MWFALLAVMACSGPAQQGVSVSKPEYQRATGQAFGTTWNVTWRGDLTAEQATSRIDRALALVDAQMSTWREDSEISRARRTPEGVAVHADTATVVQHALAVAERSGGAFDPTVQPLIEVWGIHGPRRAQAPTEAELTEARAQVDHRKVTVEERAGEWWLTTGGTALDLSAIAKGFAVDRVHAALVSQAPDVLVEIGGEVRASGDGPRGVWTLGVDRPEVGSAPGTDLVAMVPLNNQAMATSGNYRNAYEVDGQTVVHTLDPRMGRPVQTEVLSVTVVAEDCMTADAWATALMVLPLNEGQPLVASMPGVEALWFVSSPTGLTSVSTDGVAWVIRGDSAPDGIH